MSGFPRLVRLVSGSGQVSYRLGDRLVDRYLEFVAGRWLRVQPSTLVTHGDVGRAPGGRLGRRGRIGPPQQLTVEPPMRDGAAAQRQRQIPGRAAQGST